MFLSSIVLPISNVVFGAWGNLSSAFAFIGAFILIGALIPPLIQVVRTKQTYGLSHKLLLFLSITSLLFVTISVLGFISAQKPSDKAFEVASFLSNLTAFIINAYCFDCKKRNMVAAQKLNMSEMDYYNMVVLPELQVQNSALQKLSLEKSLKIERAIQKEEEELRNEENKLKEELKKEAKKEEDKSKISSDNNISIEESKTDNPT